MEPARAFLNVPTGGEASPFLEKWPARGVRARQTYVHGSGQNAIKLGDVTHCAVAL